MFQFWKFLVHHVPYELIIHPKVTVDQAVAHLGNRTPLNFGMRCPELLGQVLTASPIISKLRTNARRNVSLAAKRS